MATVLIRAGALGGRQMAFGVSADEEGNVQLLCDSVEGGALYPEEVSAYVVAELLSAAHAYTKAPITKAVISVCPSSQHLLHACAAQHATLYFSSALSGASAPCSSNRSSRAACAIIPAGASLL